MALGILGGTFDPIHNAHIHLARLAKEQLGLETVLLVPVGDPPHKTARANRQARMEMTRLAAVDAGFLACDMEVAREGKTYTVDTLRALRATHPGQELVYIIGTDTVYQLPHWRNFEEVRTLTRFAVVRRVGEDVEHARAFAASIGAQASFIEVDALPISSTDIRLRVQRAQPIAGLVPESVGAYIRETGLYAPLPQMMDRLRQTLPQQRYAHTLRVVETAVRLARIHGVLERQAWLGAALHDCAKGMPMDQMFALTGAGPEWQQYPQTLHAWAGEILAQRDYNVFDPEVLSAIRKHTTAGREMRTLDLIVYVADAIEPGRHFFPELPEIRGLAERDLDAAARRLARQSWQRGVKAGSVVHPDTLEFLGKL